MYHVRFALQVVGASRADRAATTCLGGQKLCACASVYASRISIARLCFSLPPKNENMRCVSGAGSAGLRCGPTMRRRGGGLRGGGSAASRRAGPGFRAVSARSAAPRSTDVPGRFARGHPRRKENETRSTASRGRRVRRPPRQRISRSPRPDVAGGPGRTTRGRRKGRKRARRRGSPD